MLKHSNRMACTELVAAFVIIGVLAALFQTRTVERDAEQRSAALAGLAGSVRSGAALAHSVWVSDGASGAAVAMRDGQTIEIDLLTGYPRASRDGIHGLLPNIDGFDVAIDTQAGDTTDTFVFSVVGVPAEECNVTYRTGTVTGQPPRVTVTNSDNGGDCG